jgi:hypothetical protein
MSDERITDEELAELVQRTDEATAAWMRGDMDRYLELTPHARTIGSSCTATPTRWCARSASSGRRRARSRRRLRDVVDDHKAARKTSAAIGAAEVPPNPAPTSMTATATRGRSAGA